MKTMKEKSTCDEFNKRIVSVNYVNDVNQDTSYISARQVRGINRQEVPAKLLNVNPSKYHHEQLRHIPDNVYASRNRDASTTNVFTKN